MRSTGDLWVQRANKNHDFSLTYGCRFLIFAKKNKNWCGVMTPRRIGWFLSLEDVWLTTTVHIALKTWMRSGKTGGTSSVERVERGTGRDQKKKFKQRVQTNGTNNFFSGPVPWIHGTRARANARAVPYGITATFPRTFSSALSLRDTCWLIIFPTRRFLCSS